MDTNIKYLIEEIQRFNPVEYEDNEIIDNDTVYNVTSIDVKDYKELLIILIKRLQENIEYPDFSGINIKKITSLITLFPILGTYDIDIRKIKYLDLSDWDTSNVINMQGMFSNCEGLVEIKLSSKFNTFNVKTMANMFSGCKSLISIDLSNFDTSNVQNMSDMFSQCESLKTIDISNFNTQNVIDFSFMFWDCISLQDINVSGLDTSQAYVFNSMFSECMSLKRLDLSSFTLSPRYINMANMSTMFYNCRSLEYLDISGFNKLANNISSMCDFCESLKEIKLSNELIKSIIELKNNKNRLKVDMI